MLSKLAEKFMTKYSSDEDLCLILENEGFSKKTIAEVMNLKNNYINRTEVFFYSSTNNEIFIATRYKVY